jgi:predicted enzyme related to lactoylglutathione lyase
MATDATHATDATDTDTEDAGAPVGWFEIGTDDPESARRFYGGAFGWTFAQEQSYSIITTGKGHQLQGGIQDTKAPLPDGTPSSYAVPCVQVGDVAATCGKVEDLGGKVVVPATPIPSGLVYAFVTDPAGNRIGLFTPPPLT